MRVACEDRGFEFLPVAGHIEVQLVQDQLVGAADGLFRDKDARRALCLGDRMEERDDPFQLGESGRVEIRHAVDHLGRVRQA